MAYINAVLDQPSKRSMNGLRTLALTIPALVLFGCSNPADDVPKASVNSTNSQPASAAAPAAQNAKSFAFNGDNSTIGFVGSKVTGSHNGGFKKFTGELQAANGRLAESGNKVVIDMTSLWADNDRLTGHLKSPDFFNVAQIPTATFVTKSIADQGGNSVVTGDLTLHGVTKQISFPATIKVTDASAEFSAEFAINRFDFEIKYPGKANDLIRKEVVLKIKVNAAPGKADFQSIEKAAQRAAPAPQVASR
jgi:polyisoprenoid-binding protein YceI